MDELAERFFWRRLSFLPSHVGGDAGDQVGMDLSQQERGRRGLLSAGAAGERGIERRDGVAGAKAFEHQAVAAANVDPLMKADFNQVFVIVVGRFKDRKSACRERV